ncbi:CpaE family protein [Isoptericola variabilis]|uniref:Response regulator receiver protein n=1 Tax=Isoptericola variabilis (strain 225) TaxID=743718 RepID=F6FQU6_ISOV2|nr:AAA family ATPase [Isoptericola variabilis]AEG42911.1 response regulator receiver protein [Isoptericola variabilis 225]TWH31840.1 pilus assembly protein CpaE [Isoptericola variabilis J7]
MNNVLLATDSHALQERVHAAADGACITVPATPLSVEPAAFLGQLRGAPLPDIVVLDTTTSRFEALELAAGMDRLFPGTGLILVGIADGTLAMEALRAGVRDVVPPDIPVDHLRTVLARVGEAARARRVPTPVPVGTATPEWVPTIATQGPSRVISVLSPKGGAGKTTVATNLAVGLSQAQPGSTVLIDLDLQFGDVATALGLEPEATLADIVIHGNHVDPIALKTQLTQHASGLLVACAPDSPAAGGAVTPEHVGALIEQLATQFRYVVIDTAAGLGAHTLAALDHTTDPVLLTSMDVPGVRGLRKELDALHDLDLLPDSRKVLLNFADPKAGLSLGDVQATIRTRVDMSLPHTKAAVVAMNMGVPLVNHQPRDAVAKQLRKLQASYLGAVAPGRPSRRKVVS